VKKQTMLSDSQE